MPSARRPSPVERSWTSKDSLLYAVGVGAGTDDPLTELEFTTENSQDVDQQVLPTMAVVLGIGGGGACAKIGAFNPAMLVHGEQARRAAPARSRSRARSRPSTEITGIYDKGKGARRRDRDDGDAGRRTASRCSPPARRLHPRRGRLRRRPRARRPTNAPPDREPDHEVTYQTRTDQALLYRLSGDRNPLHSDPAFAAMAGFDRPILHGLCTYGFTGRALLHALCGGDPAPLPVDGAAASPARCSRARR